MRMTWIPLSETIRRFHRAAGNTPAAHDLRIAALALAMREYSPAAVDEHPILINCAALALSMPQLTVHRLSSGAARMVGETDLHSLPGEPPYLLRGAFLLEARRHEEPLFGQTSSLGGYAHNGAVFLVGLQYPDGAAVTRWVPRWEERDLDAGLPQQDDSPLIDDVDGHHAWAREAARFAVVLGLLLMAEGSPVIVEDERPRRRRGTGVTQSGGRDWAVRRVSLDRLTLSRHRQAEPAQSEPADLTGKRASVVPVRGHIKRQTYGPRHSGRRWIYVEGYEARRWVAPGPVRIEVTET